MDIMVIGIAGGTGSGKTTITKKLVQRFGGDVSVIYHDNYYKAHHNMPYEERAKLNYMTTRIPSTPIYSSRISSSSARGTASSVRSTTTPFTTAPTER